MRAQIPTSDPIATSLVQGIMTQIIERLRQIANANVGNLIRCCPDRMAEYFKAMDFITVVSGLPRSGTSLMMQMLKAGGISPLTDNLREPDQSNPRGYFEFEPVKRLRIDQSWLDQARGRAVKVIHLLMPQLPIDGRFQYRVILMKRPMEEILASQHVMLEREGKTSADQTLLAKAYQSQLLQLEQWLRTQPNFAMLSVNYHDLIENPQATADKIDNFLGGELDVEAMARVIDPALYRQRGPSSAKD